MTSRTYRALLIANSTFPADTVNLPELEGPRNDPVVLRDALCDGEVGLFPSDNIRLVTERTMAEVLGEVEDFLRSATSQDTLLLYYSGHGKLDQTGELFLCTRDSRRERLRSTAVKASDLRAMMDESAAAATVVVLDCCHSGRFKGGEVPTALSGRGRFVLTSSRSGELANDADVRNHASLFTHHLAEGLLHGAEDVDGDGLVTLSELYTYVHAALAGVGRPVPQKRFEGDGDVAMALRPTRSSPSRDQPGLVDVASAAPLLDLSDTAIDLGEVDPDEELPPERIAVINRGGGTLDWTVESSAAWLTAVAEDAAAVLHLRPTPGPNRANVYIRDKTTGALKTVRITVRVRPLPAANLPTTAPSDSPPQPAPLTPTEAPMPAPGEPVLAPGEPVLAPGEPTSAEAPTPGEPVLAPGEPVLAPGEPVLAPGEPVLAPGEPVLAEPLPAPEEPSPAGAPTSAGAPTPTPTPTEALTLASGEPVLAEPAPAPDEAAPAEAAARPARELPRVGDGPEAAGEQVSAGWLAAGVGVAYFFGGLFFAVAGYRVNDAISGDLLKRGEWGPGLLPAILGGFVLAVVGVLTFVPRIHVRMVGCGLGLAVPLSLIRISEQIGFQRETFAWSWVLGVAASGLAVASLHRAGAWRRTPWAPRPLVGWTTACAAIWAAALLIDPYDQDAFDGSTYGGAFSADYFVSTVSARVWFLVGAASLVVLVRLGLRRLEPVPGSGVVVGVAITPLLAAVNEITYLVAADEDPDGARRLLITFSAAVALAACAVAAVVQSRRQTASPGTTIDWIRHRPRAALLTATAVSVSLLGGCLALPNGPSGEQLVTLRTEITTKLSPGAFSPDGDVLAISHPFGLDLWNTEDGSHIRASFGATRPDASTFSPDGKYVATAGTGGVRLWDAATGDRIEDLGGVESTSVVYSPDDSRLAVADRAGVTVWEKSTSDPERIPITGGAREVWFSPDGKRLAIWTYAGALGIWNVETLEEEEGGLRGNDLPARGGSQDPLVAAVAFSPDWTLVAIAGAAGFVYLLDVETGDGLGRSTYLDQTAEALAWSPDGSLLAAASGKRLELLDPSGSIQHLTSLTGHDTEVNSVVFSPDGERLASASEDSVRVWDPDER